LHIPPTWMEIVAFGTGLIVYRTMGVRVFRVSYQGWYVLQLKWEQHADVSNIAQAIAVNVPEHAVLRSEGTAYRDNAWLYDEMHGRNYLQWEPIEEAGVLAQVS
jgi:hypothetical protein